MIKLKQCHFILIEIKKYDELSSPTLIYQYFYNQTRLRDQLKVFVIECYLINGECKRAKAR